MNIVDISKAEKAVEKNQPMYSKQQALKSKLFENSKDALGVILDENRSYTKEEIKSALKHFYERKVK